jgi:CRP/FNR family cyclic AMP-dependent transcriptional regulator
MTRLPNPVHPEGSPLERFAWELRALRDRMGSTAPTVDQISVRENIPRSTLYAALRGDRLPRREVVAALARCWGADEAEWLDKRSELERQLASASSLPESDPSGAGTLSPESLDLLRNAGAIESHEPGTVLIAEGATSERVLLIEQGRVRIQSAMADGRQVVLAIRGPGEILGETGALMSQPHSASVMTVTPVTLIRLPTDRFLSLLSVHPRLAVDLTRAMARRLEEANRRRAEMVTDSAPVRVLRLLQSLAMTNGVRQPDGTTEVSIHLSQGELADAISMSREAYARALGKLRADGLVTTGRGTIRLLPPVNPE